MSSPNLSGNFAISLWFKANSFTNQANILITNPNNGSGGICISLDGGNTVGLNSPNNFLQSLCSYAFQTGVWYHIVVSRNNGNISCWVNGVNQNTSFNTTYDFSAPIALAYDNSGSTNGFNGTIDEVGIWTKFLTTQNVASLYGNGVGNQYPFGATPTTLELKDGIKAYWKLDETSGTRYDSTLNLHDLTDNGSVASGSGIINNDAVFDGSDYLELPALGSETTATWTVSQWVKFDNPVTGAYQVFSGLILTLGMQVYLRPDGAVEVAVYGNGTIAYNTGHFISDTNWHHIIVTGNSDGTVIVYVDGVLVFSHTTAGDIIAITNIAGGSFGREHYGNYYISGAMDEIAIWSRVLSQSEITTLYNNGLALSYPFIPTSGLALWLDAEDLNLDLINNCAAYWTLDDPSWSDSTGNGRSLTGYGNINTTSGKIGNAVVFPTPIDQAQYLQASYPELAVGTGDFSISCWINPSSFSDQDFCTILNLGLGDSSPFTDRLFLCIMPDGELRIGLGPNGQTYNSYVTFNSWNYITITRSSGSIYLYLNGVKDTTIGNAGDYGNYDGNVIIGVPNDQLGTTNYIFEGLIDEVGFWKRALSQLEITQLYNNGSGFAYPFNANGIALWVDKSGNNNHAVQSNSSLQPILATNSINGKSTVRFDGVSQYLADTVVGVDGSHTIFMVVNRRGTGSSPDGYEPPFSYGVSIDNGGPLYFNTNNETLVSYPMYIYSFGQSGNIDSSYSYTNDTTYIVSLPINTQTLTWPFVVNGISLGTAVANSFTSTGNNQILIGAQTSNSRYFNGDVAEVLIYNRVLTNVERYDVETYLNEKYNAYTVPSITQDGLVLWLDAGDSRSYPGTGSTWYDLSPSNNNGTLNGDATYNGNNGGAINLDGYYGYNGYVNFGSYTPANESFTLEIAFTWNNYDTANVEFLFAGNYTQMELHLGGDSGTNGIRFIPSCYPGSYLDETNLITSGVNHITVVWNAESGVSEIYKNGVFVTSASERTGCVIKTLQDLNIGRRANDSYYFSGNIYITRLYDRVLNATEITNNFNASSARFGL
jgi:hypothetical protein